MPRILYCANATYSSWSLRGWLACKIAGAPFSTHFLALDSPAFAAAKADGTLPGGTVPTLYDDGAVIWETTAIIDTLAEADPAAFWPVDRVARGLARSAAAEMHAGFRALRNGCPMNLRRRWRDFPIDEAIRADLARLETLWAQCRVHGYGRGDFLFGAFGAVDAMFAPVVTRIDSYDLPVSPPTRSYCDAVLGHPWMEEWTAMARQDTQIVAIDEVAIPAVQTLW
jgi:glutathione S-transferase